MRLFVLLLVAVFFYSCKNSSGDSPKSSSPLVVDTPIEDFRELKILDSKHINVDDLWEPFNKDMASFTRADYKTLKPLILEQNIPTLQKLILNGNLTYENLTKFYLYRIREFDRANDLSLNSVISLNPNVIAEAKQKDIELKNKKLKHSIFGMPILLKDNIDASGMATTAGAVALQDNYADDAFIVKKLKENGALILGKANLSEWAYFFCGDCPSGYSAIGGQTLNPYGRRVIDTGGSSSGSAVAVSANFCVASIGSETSGSILSPSSQNSVVGLKPTVGLLSRSGIVPISSTLDTPGPITKNVTDNAILLDAMFGEDLTDNKSINALWEPGFYIEELMTKSLEGRRFGAFKRLMENPLYINALSVLKTQGAEIIEIEEEKIDLPNFLRLLNLDMKQDLPKYLSTTTDSLVKVSSVQDVIKFNRSDSTSRMPYGQNLFHGIAADSASETAFDSIKSTLKTNGIRFFDTPMKEHDLDGILSMNNVHAGFAAVAEYPAITVPMGYDEEGIPKGLTFIAERLQEKFLLQWAYIYERASKMRKAPRNYN